jgi:hypothetical protein
MGRLIIDGNRVYEVDEQCMRNRQKNQKNKDPGNPGMQRQKPNQSRMNGGRR